MAEIKKCAFCLKEIANEDDVFVYNNENWHKECAKNQGYDITKPMNEYNSYPTSGSSSNIKVFIGLLLVLAILIGGTKEYNSIKVQKEFKTALESYLTSELLTDLKYYKSYTLSGNYYNALSLTFEKEFDNLTTKEQYNLLKNVMDKFDEKYSSMSDDYGFTEKRLKSEVYGLPEIFAYTSDNQGKKYEFACTGTFTDKYGKLYFADDMSDSVPKNSNYNSTNSYTTDTDGYESSDLTDDEKAFAWTAAINVVEQNLKAPSTADFPFSYYGQDIKRVGLSTFVVNSYVDAENSYGAKIRTYFSVKINKTGENTYTVEDFQTY